MSAMSRSSNGCWTCRIRHRKCDELRPRCKECCDRYIPCHGYGPKPVWFDNEFLLHAELTRIKHAVKENFRRNRRLRRGFSQSSTNSKKIPSRTIYQQTSPDLPFRSSYKTKSLAFQESQLLMHYLDYIFPLQYPYYVDTPESGGRGWLPWLLLKSGPLYQAILTLSTFHRYTKVILRTDEMEHEIIRYHTKALQDLRETICFYDFDGLHISNEHTVEFLACGLTLMSFEVFKGGTAGWQPHLLALATVVNKIASVAVHDKSTSEVLLSRCLTEIDDTENALRFFIANLVWFDILASSSTGTSPKICYRFWLEDQRLDLSHVMGCDNWVMIAIGDIAAMNARVTSSSSEVLDDAFNIKRRLEAGLNELDAAAKSPNSNNALISRVYVTSALVELLSICPKICSTQREIRDAVTKVMEAIQLIPEGLSLRGLTWSICVAASEAQEDQQPFFETLMVRILAGSGPGFSNCYTVWSIITQSWDQRKACPMEPYNWRDAMKSMEICALLV